MGKNIATFRVRKKKEADLQYSSNLCISTKTQYKRETQTTVSHSNVI